MDGRVIDAINLHRTVNALSNPNFINIINTDQATAVYVNNTISSGLIAASTSQTITIPTNAAKCKVTLVGAGGKSGLAESTIGLANGGGGGNGATLIKHLHSITASNTFTLTAGVGSNTVLSSGTEIITTLTAGKGGDGTDASWDGVSDLPGNNGGNGAATNGNINISQTLFGQQVAIQDTTGWGYGSGTGMCTSTNTPVAGGPGLAIFEFDA